MSICLRATPVAGSQATELPCKFRLASYTYSATQPYEGKKRMDHYLSIPGACGKLNPYRMAALLQQYEPKVFTSDESGLPLNVSVVYSDSKRMSENIILGELRLFGTLLAFFPFKSCEIYDTCDVSVSVEGDRGAADRTRLGFKSVVWVTLFSPFGSMMTDSPGEYTGVSQIWQGSGGPPEQGVPLLEEVYAKAIAAAVVKSIGKMDPNEIRRKALLNRVKEGL